MIDLRSGGLIVVSDSSLGNVMDDGTALVADPATKKVGTQGGYLILWGDEALVQGRLGRFSLLSGRSHKLTRAARSSYAAEVVAAGDGVDAAQGFRDQIAEMLYGPVPRGPGLRLSGWQVPMVLVTDSRDGHDRLTSDAGVGSASQKSINLELASIREVLDKPRTQVRWTDGTNMISDCLTKDMPADHLRETLQRGTWSIEFREELVRTPRRVAREKWEARMKELSRDSKFVASLPDVTERTNRGSLL